MLFMKETHTKTQT